MALDIQKWMEQYTSEMRREYGGRVELIGLQGSYGRCEATEKSDIDAVLILDELTVQDLKKYKQLISTMPYREKICGFVSGKNELLHWEKSDLFQFCHDTTPWFGTLDDMLSHIDKSDIQRAVLVGACNIYHSCVHNFLHENDPAFLRALYKAAFFVLQAKHFCETGVYIRHKDELLLRLFGQDRNVMDACIHMGYADMQKEEFETLSGNLITWAAKNIHSFG